jgi:hypothetical protein
MVIYILTKKWSNQIRKIVILFKIDPLVRLTDLLQLRTWELVSARCRGLLTPTPTPSATW